MAQIGLPQALGLGPGIALIPANFQSGFSSSLKPRSESIVDLSSTPVEEGSVLSGPPKGDICHRYGIEFMLLQRFYQNPDLWMQLKTKYEERQKKRILKKLKKKEALLKEKGIEGKKLQQQHQLQQQPHQQHLCEKNDVDSPSTSQSTKVCLTSTRLPSLSKDSSDENEEEEEKAPSSQPPRTFHRQSMGGGASAGDAAVSGPLSNHGFIILNSRTGVTQTVIQGPLTSKIHAKRDGNVVRLGGFGFDFDMNYIILIINIIHYYSYNRSSYRFRGKFSVKELDLLRRSSSRKIAGGIGSVSLSEGFGYHLVLDSMVCLFKRCTNLHCLKCN